MKYKPEYFKIHELVPPELISLPEDYLWGLFDESLLIVLDRLRITLGRPITINNWKSGGKYTLRGLRPKNSPVGAKNSMHKLGKAIDCDVKGMTADEVRQWILKRHDEFPEIKRLEDDVNWVHIDTKDLGAHGIVLFKP